MHHNNEKSVKAASKVNGNKVSEIIVEDREIKMEFGINSELFYKDMHWKPRFKIDQTIESLAEYFSKG